MVHLGHWVKAAEFYMRQNMPLVAADLYLNDRTRTSSALAFGCVRSVLQGQTIDEPIDPNDSDVQEIERLLSRLQRRGLKQHRTVDVRTSLHLISFARSNFAIRSFTTGWRWRTVVSNSPEQCRPRLYKLPTSEELTFTIMIGIRVRVIIGDSK